MSSHSALRQVVGGAAADTSPDWADREPAPLEIRDSGWLARFDAALMSADTVSFDIFDTALTRIVDSPIDVFAVVEARLKVALGDVAQGYAEAREEAERDARAAKILAEEVTLDDILKALAARRPELAGRLDRIAKEELDAEGSVLLAVPDILDAYRRARAAGRRVLFLSDMYLPRDAIARYLEQAGFTEWDDLIVSSETGVTKASGNAWPQVDHRFGPLSRVLHVGDDPWSDDQRPFELGVQVLPYLRSRSERRFGARLTPSLLPYSFAARTENLRPRLAVDAKPGAAEFFYGFGASFGALVVGGFVRWLAERAKTCGVEHIYFCSRDGWLTRAAWEATGLAKTSGISSSYLYVSRRTLNLTGGYASSENGRLSEELLSFLVGTWRSVPLSRVLSRAGLDAIEPVRRAAEAEVGPLDQPLRYPDGVAALRRVLSENAEAVLDALRPVHDATLGYLLQQGLAEENRRALIDAGWHGSLQASIRRLMKQIGARSRLTGFYYGLWPAARGRRWTTGWMESYLGSDYRLLAEQAGLHGLVDVLEELFSAPHGTVVDYLRVDSGAWKPVLADRREEVEQHRLATSHFQQGVVDAVRELFAKGRSGSLRLEDLTREAASAAVDQVGLAPSMREIEFIGGLLHAADFDHSQFEPLLVIDEAVSALAIAESLDRYHWPAAAARLAHARLTPDNRQQVLDMIRTKLAHLGPRRLRCFY